MKKITLFGIALLLSLSLILGACTSSASAPAPGGEEVDLDPDDLEAGNRSATLRIAVLPIVDNFPLFMADEEALFEDFELDIELIPVSSAPELSQLFASGQVDGMVTDGLTVAFFNQETIQAQIVRYAQRPSPDAGHFFILAAKESGITTPEDLKGVEIGISEGTIIEYVTDRLLEREGFAAEEITTVAVPKIPDRMALLGSGEIKAAVLPDPLASLAVSQGASIILDDSQSPEYGASVYVFSTNIIDTNPEAVRKFIEVIDTSIRLIAADPEEYRYVLETRELVPPDLLPTYVIPSFPNGIYTQQEWDDTITWAQEKGLLSVNIPYENVVNDSFLP